MIAPQVSIANVAPAVTVVPPATPSREITPAGNTARVRPDTSSSGGIDGGVDGGVQTTGEDGEARQASEDQGPRITGRQLTDLGGERLAILHDDEANRFVYQSINEESNEVERQYPTEQDLDRIASFRELAGQVVDEIL